LHLSREVPGDAISSIESGVAMSANEPSIRRMLFILALAILAAGRASAQPRAGIFWNQEPAMNVAEAEDRSPFTLGTLACIGAAFEKFSHYRVNDSATVYREREGNNLVYGVFALPSVNLGQIGSKKWPLAVILPMGVMKSSNGSADAAFGFGLSLGVNVGDRADIGLAGVMLFTSAESLTDPQKLSFEKGTPLPAGISRDITSQPVASITVGVYITPHF
jgi:hypothetical protein